jgi:hypothetical protein
MQIHILFVAGECYGAVNIASILVHDNYGSNSDDFSATRPLRAGKQGVIVAIV